MTPSTRYRVRPGSPVTLRDHDPTETTLFDRAAEERKNTLVKLSERINELEDLLCAVHKHSLLVVLQGMDAAGKDEIICDVFQRVNPQRLRVEAFSEPTQPEADHDFLWRAHRRVPGRGEIRIFDRSHYEGVLVDRVHEKVKPAVWRDRYAEINAFEQTVARNDTVILKFFLHMSKDEQRKRLEARLTDPKKRWKFAPSDIEERKIWPKYQKAYEDALNRTSTRQAPWFLIPADETWYRNLVVASIVVEALQALKLRYPRPKQDLSSVVID